MNTPLISVVIPTFNYGHYVIEAVESALAQTYPHVEVIVIDDGSTDDTRERLAVYENRIRYHYQPNAGLSAARNTGIRLSRGQLIAFLDSDDVFHARKLELQVKMMAAEPSACLCATAAITGETPRWDDIDIKDEAFEVISLDQLVVRSRFGSCGVVVRRECFDTVGYFDPDLRSAEDRDMWIRIASRYRILRMAAPLWWYRPTPGSMSCHAEKMERYERIVLEKTFHLPELRGRWLLKQKALGLAAYASALRYQTAGEKRTARKRMIASFLYWPLPVHVPEVRVPFGRSRLFLRAAL